MRDVAGEDRRTEDSDPYAQGLGPPRLAAIPGLVPKGAKDKQECRSRERGSLGGQGRALSAGSTLFDKERA